MARVFITGSADGLGLLAGRLLVESGHAVTLHARNEQRAADAKRALPACEAVLVGDLANMHETRELARQVAERGGYDAVIHNAGIGYQEPRIETGEGLEHIFATNVMAPYLHVPDDLRLGAVTQVWLATSDDSGARVSGARTPCKTRS